MTMPNFLIIGAKKCGTTALFKFMRQHPQIYMPKKEIHFFEPDGKRPVGPGSITDIESYCALFQNGPEGTVKGEASPSYLHLPGVPDRIRHYIPEIKLIAIIRNPAERAYSDFLHERRESRETHSDFAEALDEDKIRDYKLKGFYFAHLSRYFDIFDRDQIRVYLYEDLCVDPIGLLQDIFGFLGVKENFVPDVSIWDKSSGLPKSKVLHSFLSKPNLIKTLCKVVIPSRLYTKIGYKIYNQNIIKPAFPPQIRNKLTMEYREDVVNLQGLIHRDLSQWLEA